PITSGAFVYDLDFGGQADNNNNFYLVTDGLSPDGSLYQAASYLFATSFADLPGLLQRQAGRLPVGSGPGTAGEAGNPLDRLTGAWAQIDGTLDRVEADNSDHYSTDRWSLKAGYDAEMDLALPGRLIVGGYVQYAGASSTVDSKYGARSMTSQAIGGGATATYYAEGGSYADLQGRLMGVRSDLAQKSGLISTAAAASVEIGHVVALGEASSLIPSAQLQYGNVAAPSFTDDNGIAVSDFGDTRTTGRLGLALQTPLAVTPETGPLITASLDYIRDFSPDIGVTVDDVHVSTDVPQNWVEAGLGIDWQLGEDALLELRASYATALGEDLAHNSSLDASANFRLGF
ncbi:autotransporter outer membrane beta-barrel domain-containing protein, partial [Aestuariivirga sp.]|uniref:autotransporter outer membrane beta-barrel domain-containing protein n=1 Tax=Aestuariivirga sp. TaxID=2650926 RepID=UPI00301AEC98